MVIIPSFVPVIHLGREGIRPDVVRQDDGKGEEEFKYFIIAEIGELVENTKKG